MKKTLFTLTLALVGLSTAYSQVGIGTTTPQATLDIVANDTPTTYATGDGILIPRVNAIPTAAAGEAGELVYVTGVGFYYNTGGTTWVPFAVGGAIDNADLTTGTGGIYKGSGSLSVGPTVVTQGANRLEFTGNGSNGGIIAQFTNTGNNGRVLNLVRSGGIPNPGVGGGSSFIRFEQSGLNLGSFIPNADVANSTGITFLSTEVNAFSVGANGNAFSVDADNNRVGIGTDAPTEKLDVVEADGSSTVRSGNTGWGSLGNFAFNIGGQAGAITQEGSRLNFTNGANSTIFGSIGTANTSPNNASNIKMVFRIRESSTSDVEKMSLTPTGLAVLGNITATGTITPDYVFERYFDGESALKPSYTMMSLQEVEAFTRENKHLPGVPSAQEVEEAGGIILNKQSEILLEKVEELFLHTIEQQRIIDALKKDQDELKTQLKQLQEKQ